MPATPMLLMMLGTACGLTAPPPTSQHAAFARWMSHSLDWGVVASTSVHLNGVAFGNPVSFVDSGDGFAYFYVSSLDATMQDVAKNPHVSFTLSEAMMPGKCGSSGSVPDPEDPTCARLTLSGVMRRVNESAVPGVRKAMFAKHPQMAKWPASHDFFFATLDLHDVWLIDFYGGAANIKPADYYAAPSPTAAEQAAPVEAAVEPATAASVWRMGPPHGSNSSARCPVTGKGLNISATTPSLAFKNGQKLYFSTAAAASQYRQAPRDFWLSPHEMPEAGMDGMRGLPDVRGQILHCPKSGEGMNVSMQTPRVMMNHGQAVYFCCHGCVASFWRDPEEYFA